MIPYSIALIFLGLPLFILELAIGQKMRLGSIGAWTAISPYLGGVGKLKFCVWLSNKVLYHTIDVELLPMPAK